MCSSDLVAFRLCAVELCVAVVCAGVTCFLVVGVAARTNPAAANCKTANANATRIVLEKRNLNLERVLSRCFPVHCCPAGEGDILNDKPALCEAYASGFPALTRLRELQPNQCKTGARWRPRFKAWSIMPVLMQVSYGKDCLAALPKGWSFDFGSSCKQRGSGRMLLYLRMKEQPPHDALRGSPMLPCGP